jgi:hypothetical protein
VARSAAKPDWSRLGRFDMWDTRSLLDEPCAVGQCQLKLLLATVLSRCGNEEVGRWRTTLVNTAEPPRILLEGAGSCPSAHRLETVLETSLGPARAPNSGWVVALRLEKLTSRLLRAEGDITDGDGTPVARRVLSGSLSDCDALARAIGVWASLVLDAEASREPAPEAHAGDAGAPAAHTAASSAPPIPSANTPAGAPPASDALPGDAYGGSARSREETLAAQAHADDHGPEFGLGTFLMVGPEGQAIAGATPYAFIEVGRGIFLRPAVAVGQGVFASASSAPITWAAGRLDVCLRVYGLYATNHGLRFGLCGGAEGGGTYDSSSTRPFVAVGPSVEMEGDLAGALGIVLRGVAGANIVPDGFSGRIEVALSWRLP